MSPAARDGAAGAAGAARGDAIGVVLAGAGGRMGTQIVRELSGMPALRLSGALVAEHSAALGADAGLHAGAAANGVHLSAALAPLLQERSHGVPLVLDFSTGSAVASHLADCVAARVPLLIGATALPRTLEPALAAAARQIALLVAPNTSVGVNVLLELVRRAAQALPDSYDIEIVETHHRHKLDAPSGTALALGEAVAAGRGERLDERACYARHGHSEQRPSGQIGFASLRGGDVVGEHQVLYLGSGESLTLMHRVTDRAVFARGALLAGQWLVGQPPGRYTMSDFLSAEIKSYT